MYLVDFTFVYTLKYDADKEKIIYLFPSRILLQNT